MEGICVEIFKVCAAIVAIGATFTGWDDWRGKH